MSHRRAPERASGRREVICGRQPVYETLRARRRKVFRVLIGQRVEFSPVIDKIVQSARQTGAPIDRLTPRDMELRAGSGHHQSVAAEVSGYPYATLPDVLSSARQKSEPPLILLLDHIQDPQNVGSLLRVAEGAGAHGVVIPSDRSAMITPAVARASAGASEHVRVAVVTNLVRAMNTLKDEGLRMVGLETAADAKLYTDADLAGPLGLVVGSEGAGLRRLVRETCDCLVRLPLYGRVTSLNAATAGAVALYEIRRRRESACAADR